MLMYENTRCHPSRKDPFTKRNQTSAKCEGQLCANNRPFNSVGELIPTGEYSRGSTARVITSSSSMDWYASCIYICWPWCAFLVKTSLKNSHLATDALSVLTSWPTTSLSKRVKMFFLLLGPIWGLVISEFWATDENNSRSDEVCFGSVHTYV